MPQTPIRAQRPVWAWAALGLAGAILVTVAGPVMAGGRVAWWFSGGGGTVVFYAGILLLLAAWLGLGRLAGELDFRAEAPLALALAETIRLGSEFTVNMRDLRFIDVFWWIEPAYPHDGQYGFWLLDLAALVGLGGIWVWWFIWQLKRRPLLPLHDPYLQEALHHE